MNKIKTICIVDDDEIYTFTIDRVLARAEIAENIIFFPDGKKAIDFIKMNVGNGDALPDIVLLDINMPVMNGWAFLEEYATIVNQLKKKIIIYLASSSIAEEDFARARKNKLVTDYLVKPITVDQLAIISARLK